jgi:hypothetical protein
MPKLNVSTTSTVFFALACAALAGCGDDITRGGTPDARHTDAAPPDGAPDAMPDAMPPTATVSGTLAVTDVTVLDTAAMNPPFNGIEGGAINITFSDLTQGGGQMVFGTSSVGGCVVVQYDPSHPPNPPEDAGTVKIKDHQTGTPPASGLLKTVGDCNFVAALGGYVCVSNAAMGTETINATNPPDGATTPPTAIAYTFPTEAGTIGAEKLVGSWLIVNGFTTTTNFNSGATNAFPIIGQNGTTLIVANVGNTTTDGTTETITTGSYTILNGFNPIPAGPLVGANFLGAGGLDITKDANAKFPAINQPVMNVAGKGWTLSDAGDPTALPMTNPAADVVFGCGNKTPGTSADDTCGQAGSAQLNAMIVTGTATKQSLTGLFPFQMPTEKPGTDTWLSFTCAQPLGHSVTLQAGALQKIVDFNPTRVEVRVINAAGAILMDPNNTLNTTNLLAGFAVVGHTSP